MDKNYILIDNWTISNYLRNPEKNKRLSNFIYKNSYTLLITPAILTESYNKGEKNYIPPENSIPSRSEALAKFMALHKFDTVNQVDIWKYEVRKFCNQFPKFPSNCFLDYRENDLYNILIEFICGKNHFMFGQNKDIEIWFNEHLQAKKNWLDDVHNIINHACSNKLLLEVGQNKYELENKEIFLSYLDERLIRVALESLPIGTIDQVKLCDWKKDLLSIRLISLLFMYQYVSIDASNIIKPQSSDIFDHFHLSLIPYCSVLLTDKNMKRLWNKVKIMEQMDYSCKVMDQFDLDNELDMTAPYQINFT